MNKSHIDLAGPGGPSLFPSERDDLVICCASFEDRSMTALRNLHSTYSAKRGVVYVNREFARTNEQTRNNLYELVAGLARRTEDVAVAEGSLFDARVQLTALRSALGVDSDAVVPISCVTIDVTTFNRESLLSPSP
jgi:hypothetical protein